jgi:hypothetical protein
VGFDVECTLTWSFRPSDTPRLATIQLASSDQVFILDTIAHWDTFGHVWAPALRSLFLSSKILKLGMSCSNSSNVL